jgi:hypothetical protein
MANVVLPQHLRPLEDEWFGESEAPILFRCINLGRWDICNQLLTQELSVIQKELEYVDTYGYSARHYA